VQWEASTSHETVSLEEWCKDNAHRAENVRTPPHHESADERVPDLGFTVQYYVFRVSCSGLTLAARQASVAAQAAVERRWYP